MTTSLILVEGKSVKKENLKISLSNAKQLVTGKVPGFGIILHVAANSPGDLSNAIIKFAQVQDVTGVVTLMLRTA